MSHQRQLIRHAISSALSGHTSAGTNVFPTRFLPLPKVELPALAVYTLDEDVDPGSFNNTQGGTRELTRNLRLMIEGVMRASGTGDNPDDAIDGFALEIERALNADETFGGVCGRSLLESTTIEVQETGDKAIALIQIVWAVRYYTNAPELADVTLNDLDTVTARYVTNDQSTDTENAQDELDNLQTPAAPTLPDPDGDLKEYD